MQVILLSLALAEKINEDARQIVQAQEAAIEKEREMRRFQEFALEEERDSLKAQTADTMKEGATVVGLVKNVTDYGAFIDLGSLDGLLHITDMSWGRVKHPSELINVGDEITVNVAGTFAADKFITLTNRTKNPVISSIPSDA